MNSLIYYVIVIVIVFYTDVAISGEDAVSDDESEPVSMFDRVNTTQSLNRTKMTSAAPGSWTLTYRYISMSAAL